MKKVLFRLFRAIIGAKGFEKYKKYRFEIARWNDLKKAKQYLRRQEQIIHKIGSKPRIEVLFFVKNMSMWKYDELVKLLSQNRNFEVLIISFPSSNFDKRTFIQEQKLIADYCRKINLKFIPGYDFIQDRYTFIDYQPDIVVYTQPYNNGYEPWLIDAYKERALFVYTPYGVSVTKDNYFYDTYLTNIAWKIFVGSELEKQIFDQSLSVAKNNQVVTGFSLYDRLISPQTNPWKSKAKKKIIWAPHHSIDNRYSFKNSCFEQICYSMVEITKMFENEIEFAFKPHPLLKDRLIEKWGYEATEEYYDFWQTMPNTFICNGEYVDLFAHSDGMIHDSASFVCEYLLTNKPVMYTVVNDQVPDGVNNEFGTACFNMHYKGKTQKDLENFLRNVILGDKDEMNEYRSSFVSENLLPPDNSTVGQRMMNEFLKLLKG